MNGLTSRLPHRRSWLKALHWAMVPLFLWFTLVQPRDVQRVGAWAVQLHSVLGLVFVSLALLWWVDYRRRGLAGRPGPKLPPWGRRLHRALHRVLVWGVFGVALSGFGLGLTSAVLLWAGGIVPIAPPLDMPRANAWVGRIHEIEFYTLAVIALGHAGFHIWRHLWLRDNALRIMAPRVLHRFL
ncbi:cytochrome b [Oceaniglobus trochenteri]|uniref:cytochrome b n=1 Tax=Oceaniglobus trochenteri TaxID=2763260 RepID=UPI001CFF6C6D|nr:cytochrome b/b6 domain-containing protein [Oceaniglobus trochenteri]